MESMGSKSTVRNSMRSMNQNQGPTATVKPARPAFKGQREKKPEVELWVNGELVDQKFANQDEAELYLHEMQTEGVRVGDVKIILPS